MLRHVNIRITLLAVILLYATPALAQTEVPPEDTSRYQTRYTVLPFIAYSPDTRLIFGGLLLRQFKPAGAGLATRPSNLQLTGSYTLNNQLNIQVLHTIIYPDERRIWTGNTRFQKWPKFYWGIGPQTTEDDKVRMDYHLFSFSQALVFRAGHQVYAGPQLHLSRMYNLEFETVDESPMDPPPVTGGEGSTNVGLGAVFRWDRRDNIMTPTRNHFVEVGTHFYMPFIGSEFQYQRWLVDVRKYFPFHPSGRSVLAFQSRMVFTAGDVPFEELGFIGGESIMRGYLEGRYRDKTSVQVQAEYRRNIIGRVGAVVFAALGNVASSPGVVMIDETKWTAGAGLRYNINKKDPVNIRLDVGFNGETSGFYLTLGEAF